MLTLNNFYTWFHNYYQSFYSTDPEIMTMVQFKEAHSIRVASCARDLAQNISLAPEKIALAELCGLLHDIARSEQAQLKTFRDSLSFDHGDRGATRIIESKILSNLDNTLQEIIVFAVKYHNKLAVPDTSPAKMEFANITRDADKLDILRTLPPIEAAHNYSPVLLELLRTNQSLSFSAIKTRADIRLIRLGWLYDINYSWTLDQLVKEGYIENLLSSLPDESPFDEIKTNLLSYINTMLKKTS